MFRLDFIFHPYSKLNTLAKMTGVVLFFALLIGYTIHYLEPEVFPSVFEGVWWAVVTISTVGYGDFVPETTAGKILGMLLIVLGIALFSFFVTNLVSSTIIARHERDSGKLTYQKKEHYIIVGWNERSQLLIRQIHECQPKASIVLVDETLHERTEDFTYTFIKGSATADDTLRRANIGDAHTIIVTANLHTDEKTADANTVLTLLTIKGMKPSIYAIVEMVTQHQIKNADRAGADEIIQSSKYLSRLMLNGMMFHGMTGVISEMLKPGKEEHLQFTPVPHELINESFQKAIEVCQTPDAFLLGIRRKKETMLHPAKGSLLLKGDQLILYKR
ncbi:voltage-gated potassium channel [Evansella caseinilytica]|uniref:Voltage-gated potassium channel n=1 Tax=Evansella caseinilytica TaxID=1503961 RepID=A0A1H3TI67_9BACI|nr:potassium channel family protein [Evansella caseinilytica]SDZ49029.1 voltage-gated potassium channel [Evansella caseinilytica]